MWSLTLSDSNGTQTHNNIVRILDLCREYLFVRYIWLYVLIISCTRFKVNLHSIAAWMSMYSLFKAGWSDWNEYLNIFGGCISVPNYNNVLDDYVTDRLKREIERIL